MTEETEIFVSSSESNMHLFDVRELRPMVSSTSKGNQQKWFIHDKFIKAQFYYQGEFWVDNKAEVAAYQIATQLGLNAVAYQLCKIQTDSGILEGCYSENFLRPGDICVSMAKIVDTLPESTTRCWSVEKIYTYYRNELSKVTNLRGIEIDAYFRSIFLLDFLTLNEDRHLSNISFIQDIIEGIYKPAPIYDNGLSFAIHDGIYKGLSANECIRFAQSKPFSTNFAEQLELFGKPSAVNLDLGKVEFPSQRAKKICEIQCRRLDDAKIL